MMLVISWNGPLSITDYMYYPSLGGVKLLCSTAGRHPGFGAAVLIPELATHQNQRLGASDMQSIWKITQQENRLKSKLPRSRTDCCRCEILLPLRLIQVYCWLP